MRKTKNLLRGIVGLILCFSMIASFSVNVFAFENNTKETSGKTTSYSRVVTKQQAVERIMKVSNVSSSKAETILAEAEAIAESVKDGDRMSLMASASTYYKEFIIENDYGAGFTVEAGCLLLITRYSSGHEYISSIIDDWTIPSGSGTYTWEEAYCISELQGSSKVYLGARGVIEVAVNTSTSGGIQFKNELVSVGFTVSTSIGSTYYCRKVKSWDGTYYHPFI
ncbi:hypothetical protein DFR58_11760 [Anaerobacterium chartisolvens]|uniref:Uncharacterized protein n=1 Tax=Anaerobacterium chartisolvens TaxID=1297424 RepID=A0A369AVU6_9FIRM|nr:hypothetical protein [Anaerobacterium chartisolvens]RCX13520.1 hypothetical protein DFR58_11760 [Anaerobacterium chartisolvens]